MPGSELPSSGFQVSPATGAGIYLMLALALGCSPHSFLPSITLSSLFSSKIHRVYELRPTDFPQVLRARSQ